MSVSDRQKAIDDLKETVSEKIVEIQGEIKCVEEDPEAVLNTISRGFAGLLDVLMDEIAKNVVETTQIEMMEESIEGADIFDRGNIDEL